MKKNVFLITNIAPLYRSLLWEILLKNRNYRFDIFFGKDKYAGIKEINFETENFSENQDQVNLLKNIYYKNKILFWQSGIIKKCLFSKVEAAIIIGDFWIISSWIIAIILRFKQVKVIFWSHGFYGNESKLKKWIRTIFYSLANEHLLYERRGKVQMINSGFKESKLHIIFNSLDYKQSMHYRKTAINLNKKEVYPFFSKPFLPTLIFVGRLTEVKKLDYLISSLQILSNRRHEINLLIVGEGEQKEKLLELVEKTGANDKCHFYGACYSEEELSRLISTADLCVSPGNIGLTAIHCMSYGTPVLTHNNFLNQMPEVEIINEGNNGLYFKEDDLNSLSDKIELWLFSNRLTRDDIRINCYKKIDNYYNPNYQIKVIENLLENNPPL